MIYISVIIWLLFILIVLFNSKRNKDSVEVYSQTGSRSMSAQYTTFFSILSVCFVISLMDNYFFPNLGFHGFCLPTCDASIPAAHSQSSLVTSNFKLYMNKKNTICLSHYPIYYPLQVTGIILLLASFLFYLLSIFYMGKNYYPLVGIMEKQHICKTGTFKYIRHPLYTAQIVMMSGTAMIFQNILFIMLPVVFYYFYRTSLAEELILKKNFQEYDKYMEKTWMFFPYVI